MGWRFKWASSNGTDFNYDYHVSFKQDDLAEGKVTYNYEEMKAPPFEEFPGLSVFFKDKTGEVFHTYSAYARGLDILVGTYNYLDHGVAGISRGRPFALQPQPGGDGNGAENSRPACPVFHHR